MIKYPILFIFVAGSISLIVSAALLSLTALASFVFWELLPVAAYLMAIRIAIAVSVITVAIGVIKDPHGFKELWNKL